MEHGFPEALARTVRVGSQPFSSVDLTTGVRWGMSANGTKRTSRLDAVKSAIDPTVTKQPNA